MSNSRYKKVFAARNLAPYLGPFPDMVMCDDVANAPASARWLHLSSKCKHLDALETLKNLRRIHCTLEDGLLDHLARIPRLDWLQISLPRSDEIPSIRSLQQISTLVVRCNKHQSSLKFLTGLDNLKSLCISSAMGVSRLTPLGGLQQLCELYIDGTNSGRNTVQTLAPLAKLQNLRYAMLLLRVEKRNRTLKHLRTLRKLSFLHLSHDYTDADYDALLVKLPRLSMIRFNGGMRWPPT